MPICGSGEKFETCWQSGVDVDLSGPRSSDAPQADSGLLLMAYGPAVGEETAVQRVPAIHELPFFCIRFRIRCVSSIDAAAPVLTLASLLAAASIHAVPVQSAPLDFDSCPQKAASIMTAPDVRSIPLSYGCQGNARAESVPVKGSNRDHGHGERPRQQHEDVSRVNRSSL